MPELRTNVPRSRLSERRTTGQGGRPLAGLGARGQAGTGGSTLRVVAEEPVQVRIERME